MRALRGLVVIGCVGILRVGFFWRVLVGEHRRRREGCRLKW
jgi:hypothetical protein